MREGQHSLVARMVRIGLLHIIWQPLRASRTQCNTRYAPKELPRADNPQSFCDIHNSLRPESTMHKDDCAFQEWQNNERKNLPTRNRQNRHNYALNTSRSNKWKWRDAALTLENGTGGLGTLFPFSLHPLKWSAVYIYEINLDNVKVRVWYSNTYRRTIFCSLSGPQWRAASGHLMCIQSIHCRLEKRKHRISRFMYNIRSRLVTSLRHRWYSSLDDWNENIVVHQSIRMKIYSP